MKRRGAEAWYEQVKDMTPEQRRAFYEQRSREFREWLEQLRQHHPASAAQP
jgi:hypothetical protein